MNKLKEKLEMTPKYVIDQDITIKSKVYTFDLNQHVDANQIANSCKEFYSDAYKNKTENILYGFKSIYFYPKQETLLGFEKLLETTTLKINQLSDRYTFLIHHFWFGLYGHGEGASKHHHGDADYTCVYYARVPPNSSPLEIHDKNTTLQIHPKTGMLVVMTGYCLHSVPESKHTDGERIIVAMNSFKEKIKI